MTPPFYRVRWGGLCHRAVPELRPDGVWMRLCDPPPDGADEADGAGGEPASGRRAGPVPAAECERVDLVTTVCEWNGAPFLVLAARGTELLLEYLGGLAPVAAALGLERIERGVHRRWVDRDEVTGLREEAVDLDLGCLL
ncbi:hypothetical protein [Planomonospora sp. ID82291]|uniref:hypothetical protein n=1 Tax=Planomonospora sp. ID82291 TaxID=2738136 RepID=UPI0018C40553|nr:hypothetical protein [Planomonospora sp. ID82291]MBG0816642.1 hypothetical protein [Planomonospora sp. ID82291]